MVSNWNIFLQLFGGVVGGICWGRAFFTGDIGYFVLGTVFVGLHFFLKYYNGKQHTGG